MKKKGWESAEHIVRKTGKTGSGRASAPIRRTRGALVLLLSKEKEEKKKMRKKGVDG